MPQLRDYEIRCPVCAGGLLSVPAQTAQPICESCGAGFPFSDGFLDLLPESRGRRTLAQVTMEWPPLIRIYESTLWRRSSVVARAMGIDFEREFSLITEGRIQGTPPSRAELGCPTSLVGGNPMAKSKTTSKGVASKASKALKSKSTSKTTKSLAGSALSQKCPPKKRR